MPTTPPTTSRAPLVLYASRPGRAGRQAIGDLLALTAAVLAVRAGFWVDDLVHRLDGPGEAFERAGDGLSGGLSDAGRQVGRVPGVGDDLREPLDAAAAAGNELAQAGRDYTDTIGRLAFWLGVVVAAVPLLAVCGWVWHRVRWAREATAAGRLLRGGADASLFALRALARQPLRRVARVGRRLDLDPVDGWRRGDPATVAALAALELDAVGLSRPDQSKMGPTSRERLSS